MMADLKKKEPAKLARPYKEWIARKVKFETAKCCAIGLEKGKWLKFHGIG